MVAVVVYYLKSTYVESFKSEKTSLSFIDFVLLRKPEQTSEQTKKVSSEM